MSNTVVEFIGWNHETGQATLYKRYGECNGCGDCCRRKIFVRSSTILPSPEGAFFLDPGDNPQYGGEFMEPRFNNPTRETWQYDVTDQEETCPALKNLSDGKGHCTVQAEKPDRCTVFPTHPNDIQNLPNCSYRFERGETWEFEKASADE